MSSYCTAKIICVIYCTGTLYKLFVLNILSQKNGQLRLRYTVLMVWWCIKFKFKSGVFLLWAGTKNLEQV